jgi:protein-disulfide isomerase
MTRSLPFVIVISVGLLTLGSGTMLYRSNRIPVLTIPQDKIASGQDAGAELHVLGPVEAPITLEEFGDFQCPPCGVLSGPISQLEKDYSPRVRVIFRQFPLPAFHAHAVEAALASEAAGRQGRFWEMHDLLYREQSVWSVAPDPQTLFNAYAGILGLNLDAFQKDMASEQLKARIAADQERGQTLGVTATPTVFINDRTVPAPALNVSGLRVAIDAAMKNKHAPDPGASKTKLD